jgi:hypothetical protein
MQHTQKDQLPEKYFSIDQRDADMQENVERDR